MFIFFSRSKRTQKVGVIKFVVYSHHLKISFGVIIKKKFKGTLISSKLLIQKCIAHSFINRYDKNFYEC